MQIFLKYDKLLKSQICAFEILILSILSIPVNLSLRSDVALTRSDLCACFDAARFDANLPEASVARFVGRIVSQRILRPDLLRDLFRPERDPEAHGQGFSVANAVTLLAIGTILTTIQAEILVGALQPALGQFGFTEMFVGVVVVAIIGNAAEHFSAVVAARRDQMTLAVEISVGSSAQIALFVAPAVVLYSFFIGHPMSLLFNSFEIASIALSVMATSMVVNDGQSNRVEGLQLMSIYVVLALAFYFVP